MDCRTVLSTSGAAAVAALAGFASGGAGSSPAGSRTAFNIAQPMLPIVGTGEMFPVRRIYSSARRRSS